MKSRQKTGVVRVGISGWRYAGWRGVFYPPGLAQRRELEFASEQLSTIEINGSFYSLQHPAFFERWRDETPRGFVFAVKGGRFITHMKKLKDVEHALANFFGSGVLALGAKLGPVLWQLPEVVSFDGPRLERFLAQLPRTHVEAATLARGCDHRLKHPPYCDVAVNRRIRHALEVRNESFLEPEALALLRKHRVALVFADTAGRWPYAEDITSDFIYIRLHGSSTLYTSGYTDDELRWWAARIRKWARGSAPSDARLADRRLAGRPVGPRSVGPRSAGPRSAGRRTVVKPRPRDVYVYFDNDAKVHAPFDAKNLARMLGATARAPARARASS